MSLYVLPLTHMCSCIVIKRDMQSQINVKQHV